jgi:hypothetical protein
MIRRIVIFGIVLIMGLFIAFALIFLRKKTGSVANPLNAVPIDAALVLQINDFRNFEENLLIKNKIWNDLEFISSLDKMQRDVLYLDSIAGKDARISEALYESEIYLSAHFIGGRKVEYLFIFTGRNGDSERNIIGALSGEVNQDIQKTERKYEGKPIYNVKVIRKNSDQINYYLSLIDGNLLVSKSIILIENAIRQYGLPGALADDPEFVLVARTAGKNKDANLYIDFSKFPGLLSTLASDKFSQKFREYKNFAGWAEFDINISEKLIMLNGFIGEEGSDGFLHLFEKSDPVKISVDKVLPASVSAFLTIGGSDIQLLQTNLGTYLTSLNKHAIRQNRLKEIESKYSVRLDEAFMSIADNEFTLAHGGYNERGMDIPASYILVKCKSGSQAEKSLEVIVSSICDKKGINLQGNKETFSVDSDTKFTLTKFPIDNITGLLFGDLFSLTGDCYFTFLGNYLVFSDSKEALGHFLYSNVLSKTLSTNAGFKKFNSNIDQESNLLFYTNLSRSSSVYRDYLHPDIINSWEENFDKFQKIQSLGFQITEVSDMYYGNILIQYLDEYKGKPQTVWESLLDTSFTFKPQLVENHYTKQKEIFLQDRDNTIYLINKAGRILWKQRISESINSEVVQLDYYNNDKLQLIFSTENYLHIIDRNGNYVERYPVRLREKASAGMSLFDYEGNKDYRIFIPCIDKNIYAYSKEGNIISGWQFPGSDHEVRTPLNHFRIDDMDYIVFGDDLKTYILDRRGSVRVQVKELIAKSINNSYYLENNGTLEKSRIVTTDTAGHVVSISFDGNVSNLDIGEFSSGHFFDFKDVNADGKKDYIILDRDNLSVIDQERSRILDFSFPNELSHRPIYFRFSYNDRKLGFVDKQDSKIYLINNDGSLYKGFPLDGNTLFSIGYLESPGGEFNLIVGGSNNFLYNYSVQ